MASVGLSFTLVTFVRWPAKLVLWSMVYIICLWLLMIQKEARIQCGGTLRCTAFSLVLNLLVLESSIQYSRGELSFHGISYMKAFSNAF